MINEVVESGRRASRLPAPGRLKELATVVFMGFFPALTMISLFVVTVQDDVSAMDLGQFYWAAKTILGGDDPYLPPDMPLTVRGGPYPYPPLLAELATPLTVMSLDTAAVLVMATLVVVAVTTPLVLGVRDWRCYGVLLLWPPVISAIQTGNVTLWLALVCAVVWRFRDRAVVSSASLSFALAAKLFLWPLILWLVATRRVAAAVLSATLGAGLLLASWAVLGFAGLLDYPDLLRRLEEVVGEDSYTVYIVALDAGSPPGLARATWLAVGITILALVVAVGRRGDERSAFVLAIGAALALTPIVWLHYFALLVVVVALAQPRLGVLWFMPLAMVITPGSGHPTPFETAVTLAVAGLTVTLALRRTRRFSAEGTVFDGHAREPVAASR